MIYVYTKKKKKITKINYGMDTTGEKEKRTSKKNMDGIGKPRQQEI
jgi:hypothetical protein